MRHFLNFLSSASRPALAFAGVAVFAFPALAQQQQDVLLPDVPAFEQGAPAAEASPVVPAPATAPVATPVDPAAMTAPVQPTSATQAPPNEAIDDLLKKIDAGAQAVEPPPATVPEIVPEQADAVPPPASTDLVNPADAAAADGTLLPTPQTTDGATDVPVVGALPPNNDASENLFFDANQLVPEGEMGTKGGPRKVDPVLQPASKLIIVEKNYSPNSRQAQLVAAQRAVALGRYDAALEMYNTLYDKNKRDPNILLGRATTLQHLGQDDAAIQAYEELLELRPDNADAEINMLGLMGQRYPAVALQRLGVLRDKNPQNVEIVGQIAVLQSSMGQYDEAFKYLGMAASMEPHNAGHLYNMAVTADRAGKKKEALEYYEQALEIDSVYGGGRSIPRDAIYERLARLR